MKENQLSQKSRKTRASQFDCHDCHVIFPSSGDVFVRLGRLAHAAYAVDCDFALVECTHEPLEIESLMTSCH